MMPVKRPEQKKPLPPQGKRFTLSEAIDRGNQKFGKALAKLAK